MLRCGNESAYSSRPTAARVTSWKDPPPSSWHTPRICRRRGPRRGARAAAVVGHDNVVTIHAVEEGEGVPYLVMQFVAGLSLQEKLDQAGPLELKEILRIGMQVAAGLAAAHAQGIVHRDVKPANILL